MIIVARSVCVFSIWFHTEGRWRLQFKFMFCGGGGGGGGGRGVARISMASRTLPSPFLSFFLPPIPIRLYYLVCSGV